MITPQNVIRIQHLLSVWKDLENYIREKRLGLDKPAIICDSAPFSDHKVSQDALVDALATINLLQEEEQKKLERFEVHDRPVPVLPAKLKVKESHGTEKKATPKAKLKSRRPESAPPPPPSADGGEDGGDSGGPGDEH